jgi:hypothetical protein
MSDELRQRILTPHRGGELAVEIVLAEYCAGTTRLFRGLAADLGEGPRVVTGGAYYGGFDFIVTLSRRTGTSGVSRTERAVRALRALSDGGKRPLSIIVEDSYLLSASAMERLALCIERAAHEVGASVRLFLIFKPFMHWCRRKEVAQDGSSYLGKTWESREDWPTIPKLFEARLKAGRLSISELKREGLDVLTKSEAKAEMKDRLALAS